MKDELDFLMSLHINVGDNCSICRKNAYLIKERVRKIKVIQEKNKKEIEEMFGELKKTDFNEIFN